MLNKIQRQVLLTRFSTSLSSSRNLSSSFTHCGNSFSPWLRACSNCSFSSLSTEISWTSRSCQVFEACRSSSRSSEVRIRRSVPTDLIEGWKKIYGQEWELPRAHWRPNNFMRLFLFLQYLLVKKKNLSWDLKLYSFYLLSQLITAQALNAITTINTAEKFLLLNSTMGDIRNNLSKMISLSKLRS